MEALILSCGTGGGHNAAGRAMLEALERRGHRAAMFNPYTLKSETAALRIDNAYIRVAQCAPRAFGAIYELGNLWRRLPGYSPVYYANGLMVDRMEEFLSKNHFDVVLMPHLFPAEILTHLKRRGLKVPKMIFVATDYTCIPFTEEPDCDAYVIPSEELRPEFLSWGIPADRIAPLGIPVSRRFSRPISRDEAASLLGLDPEKRYILVSGGSIGAGNVAAILRSLCRLYRFDENTRIVAICGSRSELSAQLRDEYGERVLILDHTDRMDAYLRLSDVYLTKPGGLSSTEAAVMGVGLLHIAPIPGCETRNVAFFTKHGMSLAVDRQPGTLRRAIAEVEDPKFRRRMIDNQHRWVPSDAADQICRLAERLTGETPKND